MTGILTGNPGAGKSATFNRLTGASVVVSNCRGTTVEFVRGTMRIEGRLRTGGGERRRVDA